MSTKNFKEVHYMNTNKAKVIRNEENVQVNVIKPQPEKTIKLDMTAVQSFKRSLVVPGDIVKTRGVFPETTDPTDYRIRKERRPALVLWTDGLVMTLIPLSTSPGVPGTVTANRRIAIPSGMDILKNNSKAVSYLDFAQVVTANVTSVIEVSHTLTGDAMNKIYKEYFKMIAPSLGIANPKDVAYRDEIIDRMQRRLNEVFKQKEELHQEYEETLEKIALLEEKLQERDNKNEEYNKLYEKAKELSKENSILLGKVQKGESEYEKLKKILQEKEETIIKLNAVMVSKDTNKVPSMGAINNKALNDLRVKNKTLNEKIQALEKKYKELEKLNEELKNTKTVSVVGRAQWNRESLERLGIWINQSKPSFDEIIYKIRGDYEKKGDKRYYRITFRSLNEKFKKFGIDCFIDYSTLNSRFRTAIKWNRNDLIKVAEEFQKTNDENVYLGYYYGGVDKIPQDIDPEKKCAIRKSFRIQFEKFGITTPWETKQFQEWSKERTENLIKQFEESGYDRRTLLILCNYSEEEINQKINNKRYIEGVIGSINKRCDRFGLPRLPYKK